MRNPFSTQPIRRVFALLAAVLALVLSFGITNARADDTYPKLGNYSGENTRAYDILIKNANGPASGPADTYLFAIHTEGNNSAIRGYCTEIEVLAKAGKTYAIKDWDAFPGVNKFKTNPESRPKVAWIVANSYPENSLADVAAMAGVEGLTEKEAITATQAAVWHFTDGWDLTGVKKPNGPKFDNSSPEATRIMKLYKYLIGDKNVGIAPSEGPTLSAAGPDKPGKAGELVGPIQIKSNAKTVKITGAPYPLVTADGKEVDAKTAPTGVDLFLKVPAGAADGKAELKLEVTGGAYTGKILVGKNVRTQTIMVAASTKQVTLDAKVQVSWKGVTQAPTPAPKPDKPKLELPDTGA